VGPVIKAAIGMRAADVVELAASAKGGFSAFATGGGDSVQWLESRGLPTLTRHSA
jgi:hypothetical protein